MDAGVIALWIIGIVFGLVAVGAVLSWAASFFYFDHR